MICPHLKYFVDRHGKSRMKCKKIKGVVTRCVGADDCEAYKNITKVIKKQVKQR